MHKKINNNYGYTLIEIMVAMIMGSFVMISIFKIFQVTNRNYIMQETVQRMQKDGRFAINVVSYHIRMSGYSGFYGSLNSGVENVLKGNSQEIWNISRPIRGFDNVNQNKKIIGIKGFKKNTDVILLKNMNSETFSVVGSSGIDSITLEDNNSFSTGDVLLVSDIEQSSLFQVSNKSSDSVLSITSAGGTPGNLSVLKNSYNSDAEVGKYEVTLFGIKDGRNGLPALFKVSLENSTGTPALKEKELVSNIDDMQISYGVDTNKDNIADAYTNASAIVDWAQVVSVHVALLAVSKKSNLMSEAYSFSYDNSSMNFTRDVKPSRIADKSLKRVFNTFVPLRN